MRTRFAPSPTGFLHLGSVRTALFSWLLARHHQGTFILRIEDTDHERSKDEYNEIIFNAMKWLGLDWDEGPIYQSDRYDRYNAVIDELIKNDKAYYCNCSKERLAAVRESQIAQGQNTHYDDHCRNLNLGPSEDAVVRLKVPKNGSIGFYDLLHGEQERDALFTDDWILRRSDGHPTYNFAVVVDDYDMNITHVVRGDDHLNNTPKQVSLYQALNWPMPKFCHIPMILDEDGSRLSKRSGSANVLAYREEGYLPDALLNAIVRLGWSHGNDEIFSREQLIELFDFNGIHRSAACFNQEKFHWTSRQHMQSSSVDQIIKLALEEGFLNNIESTYHEAIVTLFKDRSKNLKEMVEQSLFLFEAPSINLDDFKKNYPNTSKDLLEKFISFSTDLTINPNTFFQDLKNFCNNNSIKIKDIALPLRVILTGTTESPDLGSVVYFLKKEEVIFRVKNISKNL